MQKAEKKNGKKLYIIFTADIHGIGGMQMYVSGIADYLTRNNFDVVIFFPGLNYGECLIPDLSKYVIGGNELFFIEPGMFNDKQLDNIYKYSIEKTGIKVEEYERIYVESQADIDALWAEYFAMRMGGKHIGLLLNETFVSLNKRYKEYKDFFWHMYENGRLYSTKTDVFFKEISERIVSKNYGSWGYEREPIADTTDYRVDNILHGDYNVAYIGRGNKEYVPTIIDEVRKFAMKHANKKITFVFVGDYLYQNDYLQVKLASLENINLVLLGNMVPIPRNLYKRIDVVIANSQTAFFSAWEGIPVIMVSSEDMKSSGILGYNCPYHGGGNCRGDICEDISETLEDVFGEKKYLENSFFLEEKKDLNNVYSKAVETFEKMGKQEYFNVCKPDIFNFPNNQVSLLESIKKECERWMVDVNKLRNSSVAIFGMEGICVLNG